MTGQVFKSNRDAYVAGSRTLRPEFYTSPEIFDLEMEKIYRHFWICLGHESKLPKGEYYLQQIIGNNLIVLRDHQGVVRVFYNTCSHRGSVICQAQSGKLKNSLQCEYHEWTYGLDGRLLTARFMKDVKEFKFEENGLIPVPLHIQDGFMFINLSKGEVEPFEEQYAPMMPKFNDWNGKNLRVVKSVSAKVRSNWKNPFSNFNECGHCPGSHKLFNTFVNYTSAEHDLTEGPFLGGYMDIKDGESITMSRHMCALPISKEEVNGANRGWYYSALPNTLWNKHRDYIMVHHLFPISANETVIMTGWLFHEEAIGREDFRPEEAIKAWTITNEEDWHLCEINQLGQEAGGNKPGWHAPNESLLIAFDREIERLLSK